MNYPFKPLLYNLIKITIPRIRSYDSTYDADAFAMRLRQFFAHRIPIISSINTEPDRLIINIELRWYKLDEYQILELIHKVEEELRVKLEWEALLVNS